MLPTQSYPNSFLQALEQEEREMPEFDPYSFGNPEEDPDYCRGTYPNLQNTGFGDLYIEEGVR